MNAKNDTIQHMNASRIHIKIAIWAIKELLELIKAVLAEKFNLRYNRDFLTVPRLFQNQTIFRQVQHEGMNIVLLQPEEKRLIDEKIPDKAIYFDDEFDMPDAQFLRTLLTVIINRVISTGESIGQDSDKAPHFLYYTDQLIKIPGDSLESRGLLGEVLITSANGRFMWIAGLMELIGYCEQLFSPYAYSFDGCPHLKIPNFTSTNNVAISDIVEIPFDGPLSLSSFEIIAKNLDQFMTMNELVSRLLIQFMESETSHLMEQKGSRHQRKVTLSPLTQAEAAIMYDVDERTIRNWENNQKSAPWGFPGRAHRSEMEMHAKIYVGEKIARSQARALNRHDLREHNQQTDFPASSDPHEVAAWYEMQSKRITGKQPEK